MPPPIPLLRLSLSRFRKSLPLRSPLHKKGTSFTYYYFPFPVSPQCSHTPFSVSFIYNPLRPTYCTPPIHLATCLSSLQPVLPLQALQAPTIATSSQITPPLVRRHPTSASRPTSPPRMTSRNSCILTLSTAYTRVHVLPRVEAAHARLQFPVLSPYVRHSPMTTTQIPYSPIWTATVPTLHAHLPVTNSTRERESRSAA